MAGLTPLKTLSGDLLPLRENGKLTSEVIEMLEELRTFLQGITPLWGFLFYWVPVAVCMVCYTIDNFRDFAYERIKRDEAREGKTSYRPTLTFGKILWRYVLSIIPVVNLLAALFSFAPRYLSTWWELLTKLFDMPVVPWTQEDERARTEACNLQRENLTRK